MHNTVSTEGQQIILFVRIIPAYRDSGPVTVSSTQDTQKFLLLMHRITGSQESSTWESNLTLQIPTRGGDVPPLSDTITASGEDWQSYKVELNCIWSGRISITINLENPPPQIPLCNMLSHFPTESPIKMRKDKVLDSRL